MFVMVLLAAHGGKNSTFSKMDYDWSSSETIARITKRKVLVYLSDA